jgi:hypothetical protein
MSVDVKEIAGGLTKAQRSAWIETVLACAESDANRLAFIDGYNDQSCRRPWTRLKLQWHARGLAVRAHLLATEPTA